MNCKNTPKHDIGADVVFFLRSKKINGEACCRYCLGQTICKDSGLLPLP